MRRYSRGTKKPCPGCGAEDTGRASDKVCANCRAAITDFKAIKESIAAACATNQQTIIRVPGIRSPHWWAGFYQGHGGQSADVLRATMAKLVWALSTATGAERGYHINGEMVTSENYSMYEPGAGHQPGWQGLDFERTIPTDVLKIVRDLYDAIAQGLFDSYQAGKENGSNVLLSLASGEMSVHDFNEATMPKRRRAR